MKKWVISLAIGATLLAASVAGAQDELSEQERERIAAEAERAMAREQRRVEVIIQREQQRVNATQEAQRAAAEVEVEMREAESRMAEAARRIAELSARQMPNVATRVWRAEVDGKPVLGISIGAPDSAGPVEGVNVLAVSPGGAAADAGLRAGDVITAVNTESLSAATSSEANQRLLDFMSAVEEGDMIDVEYLRAGKSGSVSLSPRPMGPQVFSFGGPGGEFHFPAAPVAPGAPNAAFNRFVFSTDGHGFGDMEMVKVTAGLGRYFGTDEGLLVIRAPKDDSYQLQDGDVILDIDGRKPASVSHAIRILGSYQQGESLDIRIMRDKRERTLGVEMPQAGTQSRIGGAVPAPEPAAAPQPAPRPPVVQRRSDEY